jgi:hypothetical protein
VDGLTVKQKPVGGLPPVGDFQLGGFGETVLRRTGAMGVAIARTQGAPIAVLSGRLRTPQRGVQRGRAAQPLFRQTLLVTLAGVPTRGG